jgi:hypothetical protein
MMWIVVGDVPARADRARERSPRCHEVRHRTTSRGDRARPDLAQAWQSLGQALWRTRANAELEPLRRDYDAELLGNAGRLRTKVCWAAPPFAAWDCSRELRGVRLDGPVAFFHGARLFVVARKHFLEPENRKRTSLYELIGDLDGGDLEIVERGELPSAGDTAYAGVAQVDRDRFLLTWYSSRVSADPSWLIAILGPTNIWQATLDLSRL